MSVILETFVFDPREPSRRYHRWERDFERRQALRRASFDASSSPARRSIVLRALEAIRTSRRRGLGTGRPAKGDVVFDSWGKKQARL